MGLWRVLSDLEEEGYRVETGIFSAEEVGAPHQRKRVFILGYSEGTGLPCGIMGQREEQLGRTGAWDDKELANPTSRQPRQSQARNGRQDTSGGSEDTQWPARPGEEQYEWEEPRVTEAQSQLGGATNGHSGGVDAIANRLDRLRACGNGVVPETAAKAFVTLINKLI